jgi:hypothetical protein
MRPREQATKSASLAKSTERRIRLLQTDLKAGHGLAERKVRQLERAQLFYAVVTRLGSDEAVMPEVARAQMQSACHLD